MQIHELNTLNGNLGSSAFVAVDNGTDTGKVSVPNLTKNVEEQIEQVNDRVDNIIAGGTAPSAAEVTDARLGIYGTFASLGAAIRGDDSVLKNGIDQIANSFVNIEPYLVKVNAYINNSGAYTTLSGYNVYKIPVEELDVIIFSSSGNYWGSLSGNYKAVAELNNNTYEFFSGIKSYGDYTGGGTEFIAIGVSNLTAIYINVQAGNESMITIAVNKPKTNLSNDVLTSKVLTAENTITTLYYIRTTGFSAWTSPYRSYFIKANAGDIVRFNKTVPGVTAKGAYITDNGTITLITATEFIAPDECVINIWDKTDVAGDFTYIPIKSIKIAARDVIGDIDQSQFNGMDGVAFGTSLTARSINNDGYLDYLPTLSGITFDNQGIGSAYILGNMLTAIKGYASYSDKQICLIEGFVNDWFNNKTLGTWKDSGETTVCGCVRSAINYIMSQNANITLFLILDHYGKNNSGSDCSTTAVNGAGLTQYEFYSEIAKVAESLGIPVIKEFEDSGISENTPQYLLDNIHCNALGALQSAYAIWYQLKQYPANQV